MSTAWALDTAHSEVGFWVRHMMVSKVRGQFKRWSGTVELADEKNLEGAKVTASIEVASIDTREEQRDGHLKSPDFFDVEKHPHITFTSTKIAANGKDKYTVTGDLTIRGVTKEVALDVSYEGKNRDPWGNDRLGFSAQTVIHRKDFGVTWNQTLDLGGVAVGEDVHVNIEVELSRPASAA